MEVGVHIIVKGMVQGVGFRYFVYNSAVRLTLKGFVRNLFDETVEIDLEGERSLIEECIKEVKIGPRSAHVADLIIEWKPAEHQFRKFEIR